MVAGIVFTISMKDSGTQSKDVLSGTFWDWMYLQEKEGCYLAWHPKINING